jgi:hypothetical protein
VIPNRHSPPIQVTQDGTRPGFVLPETTAIAVIGCLDLLTTIFLIATGQAHEANPLMAGLLNSFGPGGLIGAKFVFLAGPLVIAESARKKNPAFVRTALRIGIILYITLYVVAFARYNQSID